MPSPINRNTYLGLFTWAVLTAGDSSATGWAEGEGVAPVGVLPQAAREPPRERAARERARGRFQFIQ